MVQIANIDNFQTNNLFLNNFELNTALFVYGAHRNPQNQLLNVYSHHIFHHHPLKLAFLLLMLLAAIHMRLDLPTTLDYRAWGPYSI